MSCDSSVILRSFFGKDAGFSNALNTNEYNGFGCLLRKKVPGEVFSLGDFAIVLAVKDFPLRICNSRG